MKKQVIRDYTSNDTWVCPPGVTKIILFGMGGGAGGYGGGAGDTTTGGRSGPGGISCAFSVVILDVVPNTSYAITIGSGGPGGTGSTSGRDAVRPTSDGGDTTFGALATFKGANGSDTGGQFATIRGPSDFSNSGVYTGTTSNRNFTGCAEGSVTPVSNVWESLWFEEGSPGTASGASTGGGAGVPGNSSQFGAGGNGGNGGVFGGAAASNGADAAANTGAGGGSGGGSAKDPGANLPGGDGGDGGSGRLRIMYFE